MSKSKAIGTKAETAVNKAFRRLGFPFADRHVMKGALDEGDLWLCPGVIVEVKGGHMAWEASDNRIESWLSETDREKGNANADVAFLVIQRKGVGEANAQRWWAIFDADEYAFLVTCALGVEVVDPLSIPGTIRTTVEDAAHLLRMAGWGDPL